MTVVEECSAIVHDARTVEQAIGLGSSYGGLHIASHLHLLPAISQPLLSLSQERSVYERAPAELMQQLPAFGHVLS